jgi:flagellar export protein FliJ
MRRFRFVLAKLLKLRQGETEQAKRSLAGAIVKEGAARERLTAASVELTARIEKAVDIERDGLSAFGFGSLRSHLTYLQRAVDGAERDVTQAVLHTVDCRQTLLGTRQRERILDRLQEARLEEHNRVSLNDEQKELDEYGKRRGLNFGAS